MADGLTSQSHLQGTRQAGAEVEHADPRWPQADAGHAGTGLVDLLKVRFGGLTPEVVQGGLRILRRNARSPQ